VASPISPSHTVLVYDGDCAFCEKSVGKLRDRLPVFPHTVTSQSINLDDWGLSREDVARYAWLITPTKHVAGGAILRELLIRQPRLSLRFLGHLLGVWPIPMIAEGVYRMVANNRGRLSRASTQCESGPLR
jgi:predicted DCC family thiol-disulfide oxidoreductase YuxK